MAKQHYERTARGSIKVVYPPSREESKARWQAIADAMTDRERERYIAFEQVLRALEVEEGLPENSMSAKTFPGAWREGEGLRRDPESESTTAVDAPAPEPVHPYSEGVRKMLRKAIPNRGRGTLSIDWPETLWWLIRVHVYGQPWKRIPLRASRKRWDDACDLGYFEHVLVALPSIPLDSQERSDLEKLCKIGIRRGEDRRERGLTDVQGQRAHAAAKRQGR